MICCSFGTQETKQLPFTLRVISTLTHSVVLFSTCVYIMASNNSENTHLRGDLGTKQSLAALLLWNSFPFGALICQVFLRSTEQGSLWSASLHVTYRPLSSLAFVLSWMHWSCLMCTLRSGPLRSLFPACRRSPPSVCTHTHTGTQTAHIHSLKPLYLNLRCQVLWKMITQSSCHSATEPCCIWLLQNFYSGHEILWRFSTFVQFAQNCSYLRVIVEGPMWLDVLFNIRVKTFLFDKAYI